MSESHPVLSSRKVALRERSTLSRRWKRRVELSRGTTMEEAGHREGRGVKGQEE